nr:ssl1498 family light-harvesting-like protein [Microcoleus sp. FACHB-68]
MLEVPVGRTVDNEGLNNNYAMQPAITLAEYPSPEQQKGYAFQGAIAIVFVALTLLTVFVVS